MLRSYWARAGRRAWAETAALLGLDTWAQLMIRALVIGAIIIALIIYGSADSATDNAIERTVVFCIIILLLPFVFAWKLVAVPAKMDHEAAHGVEFTNQIEALKSENRRLRLQLTPKAVKRSPTYIRLKFMLDPEKGNLSPGDKLTVGEQEFSKLYDLAIKGDFEAYYNATYVAEWQRENARKMYASSYPFQDIQISFSNKLDELYKYFQSLPSSN